MIAVAPASDVPGGGQSLHVLILRYCSAGHVIFVHVLPVFVYPVLHVNVESLPPAHVALSGHWVQPAFADVAVP